MPKVRIRNGNLTIPLSAEIREKLDVHGGDELDAHVFRGSVTFTRKTEDARREAGERIMLDKHIGIFRKDFDEFAARVKRLEQLVLK